MTVSIQIGDEVRAVRGQVRGVVTGIDARDPFGYGDARPAYEVLDDATREPHTFFREELERTSWADRGERTPFSPRLEVVLN